MRVAVVGATGYAGQEVVKILSRHPEFDIVALTSARQRGEDVRLLFPFLTRGPREFAGIEDVLMSEPEWVFSCQGPKQAVPYFAQWVTQGARIVDFSADFRFPDPAIYEQAYGPHPAPDLIPVSRAGYADDPDMSYPKTMKILGNPGCYPTAFYAAVGPLVAHGVSHPFLIVDGKSGLSGAGRTPRKDLMMAEMAENVTPYNDPGKHRHTLEMEQLTSARVLFQPHYMPMSRGIELTIYIPHSLLTSQDVMDIWKERYIHNSFVTILTDGQKPHTRRVRGTNRVELGAALDDRSQTLVLYSVLDNLQKGAAGQAVQHVNRWMGWPMELGLE